MAVSVVVVGTSLGGLTAMKVLLSGLPRGFQPPVVVVQHRIKTADDALVNLLAKETPLSVSEPNDKEPLESGHVYLAPADYHLLLERGFLTLSTEAPVNHARPSIDVLFESAAVTHGRGVVGVILTGSNHDGAIGSTRIKERGGALLVQDAARWRPPPCRLRSSLPPRSTRSYALCPSYPPRPSSICAGSEGEQRMSDMTQARETAEKVDILARGRSARGAARARGPFSAGWRQEEPQVEGALRAERRCGTSLRGTLRSILLDVQDAGIGPDTRRRH